MDRFDPRAELAPRDVVARAIDHEIKRLGLDYVHLDISHQPADFVRGHFPNIHEKLLGLGIDMTVQPIPVVDVEIRLDDPRARLKPGQPVRVEVTVADVVAAQ